MHEKRLARILEEINRATLEDEDSRDMLPDEVLSRDSCREPGASESEIQRAEARLDVKFPSSFCSFLRTSNGWWGFNDSIERLRPRGQLDWFRVENSDWIESYVNPPVDRLPHPIKIKEPRDPWIQDLPHTLQISDVGDSAVVLLNPKKVRADGEWEVFFLANWGPDADVYPSFLDFLEQAGGPVEWRLEREDGDKEDEDEGDEDF